MLKPIAILASIAATAPSYAQGVRVFNGATEHIYGPGGQVLDSPELRAKNERAERRMRNEQWDRSGSDQQRTTLQTSRRQAPRSWWNEVPQQRPASWWADPSHQNPPKSSWDDR